jgi:hypothetical protein
MTKARRGKMVGQLVMRVVAIERDIAAVHYYYYYLR